MTGFRCPSLHTRRWLLGVVICVVGVFASSGSALAWDHGDDHHGDHHGGALYVSPTGGASGWGNSCANAAYATIQSAVNAARSGGTVIVCPGTYTEDVVVSQPLTLVGLNGATVQGSPTTSFTCDQLGPGGPGSAPCLAGITIKSSWVKVQGFTVTGAIGEGILATGSLMGGPISDVEISHNRIINNDADGVPPLPKSTQYPQCAATGQVPGDCGEGIHLMGVSDSRVSDNYVTGNTGGVLLTDEFGPTHDNVVARNNITGNLYDCGVTAPGHNPFALDSQGNLQPDVAGVYDNVIRDNAITGNGLNGEGAGVLFANAGPGTASYDNLVLHNYIAGNELSGVTMHAHTLPPGTFEYMSGNAVVGNVIGTNNVGGPFGPGDPLDAPASPSDPFTTGILVFSGTVPVTTTIVGNTIFHNHYGVWLGTGSNVTPQLRHNRFFGVDVPVFTAS